MIKAYLTAVPTLYEGEDIVVRYSIFQDGATIQKELVYLDYVKPVAVGAASLLMLLQKLKLYNKEEIQVMINDTALSNILKGSTIMTDGELIKMTNRVKKQVTRFCSISFVNVTMDKQGLTEWKEMLEFKNAQD